MKKNINFIWLFLGTTIIWYLAIVFIKWELDWIKHIASMNSLERIFLLIVLMVKIVIDYLIWKHLNDKPVEIEKQSTYIYKDK